MFFYCDCPSAQDTCKNDNLKRLRIEVQLNVCVDQLAYLFISNKEGKSMRKNFQIF